jgi:hypothetical protein
MTKDQIDALRDVADMSCTSGYDNDGATGYEIFSNGFALAEAAAGLATELLPLAHVLFRSLTIRDRHVKFACGPHLSR